MISINAEWKKISNDHVFYLNFYETCQLAQALETVTSSKPKLIKVQKFANADSTT